MVSIIGGLLILLSFVVFSKMKPRTKDADYLSEATMIDIRRRRKDRFATD